MVKKVVTSKGSRQSKTSRKSGTKSGKKQASTSQSRRSVTKKKMPKKVNVSGSRIALLLFQISLVLGSVLLFWVLYLNAVVTERFEGHRFVVPARVYSDAQALYRGAAIDKSDLIFLLRKLGYRESSSLSQAGRYVVSSNQVNIFTRGFRFWDSEEPTRKLSVIFEGHEIQRVVNQQGIEVPFARLDPLYLGPIYPGISEDRIVLTLDQIPEQLTLGLILLEDARFFQHKGVSFKAILRALKVNLVSRSAAQGGSTLTNQLVKNLYLSSEKTLTRKINEALMSFILEYHYSKAAILETYMNEVYMGQQGDRAIHGFGLAAQFYFGSTLQSLALHQQALLVGLIKGPSYYNPRRSPQRVLNRRNLVLKVWRDKGLIDQEAYEQAISQPLDVSTKSLKQSYPAYMNALRRQLQRQYKQKDLQAEGLAVFTTLDPIAQMKLEGEIIEGMATLRARGLPDLQTAAVLTRPSTADIIAMVGGAEPKVSGFNRALDARRPVGSLMKPAVILAALESGRTLADIVSDAPVTVADRSQSGTWTPRNYDRESHGNVLMVDALVKSYNQATVRLAMEVGLSHVFDVMKRLGLTEVPFVPSVILGTNEMSPYEVAQMYQPIAAEGLYSNLNLVRAIRHPEEGVLSLQDRQPMKRFDAQSIYILQEAMHQVTLYGTAAQQSQKLPKQGWFAGKTGTTNDNRDSWFAGFSGDYQLVIWVGHDDNQPTTLTGSSGALAIWVEVMNELMPVQKPRLAPPNIVVERINEHGIRVPKWCSSARELPFIDGNVPDRSLRCSKEPTPVSTDKKKWWQRLLNR